MARPPKSDAEKLTKTVAFRLTEADHAAYQSKFLASGLTQSEFFREHVLNNTTEVIAKAKPSADLDKLLFLASKASNNINQLAHQANAAHLAGQVSERTYTSILSALEQLNSFLVAAAKSAN